MAKIVLNDTTSGSPIVITENFRKIEEALNDKVLYRLNPPANPNQMENALDMNSNDIINAGVIRAKRVEAEQTDTGDIPIVGEVDDNELVKWDKDQSAFVGTGVLSNKDGGITTSSNSVNIGVHDLGSAGRNILFTNRVDNRHFDPINQEVGLDNERNTNAFVRERGQVEEIDFVTDTTEVLVDPNAPITTTLDRTVFSITLWPAIVMDTNVRYEILENDVIIYQTDLGTFDTAEVPTKKFLDTPYDLYAGENYVVRLYRQDGQPCRFRGSADGRPYNKAEIRQFVSKELATKEYVDSQSGGGGVASGSDSNQILETDNVPETLTLSAIVTSPENTESLVSLEEADNAVRINNRGLYTLGYNVQVIRSAAAGGLSQYGVWLEQSPSLAGPWEVISGTASRLNLPSAVKGVTFPLSITIPYRSESAPVYIRGRHVTDNVSGEVGVTTYIEDTPFPSVSGFSLFGIKHL